MVLIVCYIIQWRQIVQLEDCSNDIRCSAPVHDWIEIGNNMNHHDVSMYSYWVYQPASKTAPPCIHMVHTTHPNIWAEKNTSSLPMSP